MPTQRARINSDLQFGRDAADNMQQSQPTLVVRNYDSSETHSVHIQLHDTAGNCAFERTLQVDPSRAITTEMRCDAANYTITAQIETGSVDMTRCDIETGMDKTALIETGNGSVRVVDDFI